MAPRTILAALAAAGLVAVAASAAAEESPSASAKRSSLRVLGSNPRYFTDGSGRAIFLTGSHVWWNLLGKHTWKVDCERGRVRPFRYGDYLDHLVRHNHNFIRLWTIELTKWEECGETVVVAPQPWLRTGPGDAHDGLPKFDLRRLNPAYFRRLRARVVAARRRGLYVSVMLFEGWAEQFQPPAWRSRSHPFDRGNNVNSIDPDLNGDGTLVELYTMRASEARRFQEAYVRRVLATVGDLDNVLYEVANESGLFSVSWQYHMIRLIRRYERARGRRHPIGMSYVHGDQAGRTLRRSPADWIAPYGFAHLTDPPVATGRKVIVSDTDHHCGGCGDGTFPWRTFLRGYHPIFMDEMTAEPRTQDIRLAMGRTRRYARKIDLARARPRPGLCSTRYCLVVSRRQYLVYQPDGGSFTVDLRAAAGRRFTIEWAPAVRGPASHGGRVSGGAVRTLTPPFPGAAVAFLESAS